MSEHQYISIGSPPLEPKLPHSVLRTASGAELAVLGTTTCTVWIGGYVYVHPFIVCKELTPAIILGRDFLSAHKMKIAWGHGGVIQLMDGQDTQINVTEVMMDFPATLPAKVKIPPHTAIVTPVLTNLPTYKDKTHFIFTPLKENPDIDVNCVVYPLDYATLKGGNQRAAQLLVNLAQEEIILEEGMLIGYYERADCDEVLVMEENTFGVNVTEDWPQGDLGEDIFKGNDKGFIASPADVDPRKPVKLKDAKVSPEQKQSFVELCHEYQDIFSKDSTDLGKTPLLQMEIPTGSSPPVSQKPYTLALKHIQWVQDEIETLEKAGIITKSVSPWASPIVIVPKKTAPGEPP